ncbi:malonic semialdehyde reductase [bacterium]|nr:malonic semialdehyde reductase [bacterium]
MSKPVPDASLDQLFRAARTHNSWRDDAVPEVLIRAVYDLHKFGPTSANCSPARYLFISSPEAKARLEPLLSEGNRKKTMSAPWVAVIAYDEAFAEKMPKLFPHNPGAKDWFKDPAAAFDTAFRNGTLQGAYLMLAARSLGLDCGPMSGFDKDGVNREFFAGDGEMKTWKANFLCSLGHGGQEGLFPRSPRLDFEEAARIL